MNLQPSVSAAFTRQASGHTAIYFAAGYPFLQATATLLRTVQQAGATLIEVGIPYSDPLADGPVIEKAAAQALKNGMNLRLLLQQLHEVKAEMKVPVLLMGYTNQIMQYGWPAFCADAAAAGVSGLILPDLPVEEYLLHYAPLFREHGLEICFLITPDTSEARLQQLVEASTGFVYAVSSSSITGADKNFDAIEPYLRKLQTINAQRPVMMGFGIKQHAQLAQVQQYVAGGIVGTAFVEAIAGATNQEMLVAKANEYLNKLLPQ